MKAGDCKVGLRVMTKKGHKRGVVVEVIGQDRRILFDNPPGMNKLFGYRLAQSLIPEPVSQSEIVEATYDAFAKAQ